MKKLLPFFAFMLMWFAILGWIAYSAYQDAKWGIVIALGGMAAFGVWFGFVSLRAQLRAPAEPEDSETEAEDSEAEDSEAEDLDPAATHVADRPLGQTIAALACFCWSGIALLYLIAALVASERSASWPTAQATIVESDYWTRSTRKGTAHSVDVDYEYRVHGRSYENDRIAAGPSNVSSAAAGQRLVARYRVGATVPVRYHPDYPWISLLEPRVSGWFLPIIMVVLPLFVGVLMLTGRKDSRGRISAPLGWQRARRTTPREPIDFPSAVRRLFPAFGLTFWVGAELMRRYNIAQLGQSPEGPPTVRSALIWGAFMLGMLVLNKWWLPPISQRAMIYVGVACGIVSAIIYTYLPYTFTDTTNPVHYYFKSTAAWVLSFNVFPLLPAIVLADSVRKSVPESRPLEHQPA